MNGNREHLGLNLSFEVLNNESIFELMKYSELIKELEKEAKDG